MASARTVLGVTITFVWHSEEQSIRPDGNSAQGGGNGSVVYKELMFHHLELFVATDSQVWCTDTDDRTVRDICESIGLGFLNKLLYSTIVYSHDMALF